MEKTARHEKTKPYKKIGFVVFFMMGFGIGLRFQPPALILKIISKQ